MTREKFKVACVPFDFFLLFILIYHLRLRSPRPLYFLFPLFGIVEGVRMFFVKKSIIRIDFSLRSINV